MEAFVDQQIALLQMQSSMAETDYRKDFIESSYCARVRIPMIVLMASF